jgi:hypothetical protein
MAILNDMKAGCEEEAVSKQLFAWSFSSLVSQGILNPDGSPGNSKPRCGRAVVNSPGYKARVVTKGQAALITYGQPIAHMMNDVLSTDPSLRSGLKGAAQAFEYIKRQVVSHTDYVLLGDFQEATDHVGHETGQIVVNEVLDMLGIRTPYIRGYFDLILRPMLLHDENGDNEFVTSGGALMGLPGTKIVLHLMTKVISLWAKNIISPRDARTLQADTFSAAGDDIIDRSNDLRVLQNYRNFSTRAMMCPSKDKWMVLGPNGFGTFCEQVIESNGDFRFRAIDFDMKDKARMTRVTRPKETGTALIDIAKMRLLSPEALQGHGDQERNPIFGKSHQLTKEAQWSMDLYPGYKKRLTAVFRLSMSKFMFAGKSKIGIPIECGGLGQPWALTDEQVEQMPILQRRACEAAATDSGRIGDFCRRALRSWANIHQYSRGIEQYDRMRARSWEIKETIPCYTLDEVEANLGLEVDKKKARFWDRLKAVQKRGYLNVELANRELTDYWDEKTEVRRGYPNKPFKQRDECLLASLRTVENELTRFQPISAQKMRKFRPMLTEIFFYEKDDDWVEVDGINRWLNIAGDGVTASVSMRVPNRSMWAYRGDPIALGV